MDKETSLRRVGKEGRKMKEITIKLGFVEAQILRHELHSVIQVKEALKECALKRMQNEMLSAMERDIGREQNELLSIQIGLYRDICGQIFQSTFDTKL